MSFLLETAIKISLVTGLALVAVMVLRRQPAALKHWMLATAMLTAMATPLLMGLAPSWSLPVPVVAESGRGMPVPAAARERASRVGVTTTFLAEPVMALRSPTLDPTLAVFTVWLAGVALNLGGLLLGFWRLHRVAARAVVVEDGPWVERARVLAALFNLRRPVRLLQSDQPALLVTWGLFTPKVMLPADASSWAADRIHVVLAHELAHIRRSDWIIQIASELLRIVYWFNPLMWLTSARLRLESERACDDAVVNLGVSGRDYATHLLEVARQFGGARHAAFPAVAIAPRPSTLERRVRAMLNTHLSRRPLSTTARLGTIAALLAVALPVALFAQNTFATISGSIRDLSGAVLPGVQVSVVDTGRDARRLVHTDGAGRFQLLGLSQGEYTLEARLPGFETFQQKLTVSGQDVSRNITLGIGKLQELVSVSSGGPSDGRPYRSERGEPRPPYCGSGPAPASSPAPRSDSAVSGRGPLPIRVGGQIRQPRKVFHVAPIYPVGTPAGTVKMDALIDPKGVVVETKVTNDAPPVLVRAAVDAVSQWEFDPTLLNCAPVPVRMSVVVDFR
jgi:beta-lactamase regulating signal transducer with metallopeptidase domain